MHILSGKEVQTKTRMVLADSTYSKKRV